MKRKIYGVAVIVVVLGLMLAGGTGLFAHGWGFDFNDKPDTLTGTVSFRWPGGIFLKTDDAKEYKLGLGPIWHLDSLNLELSEGDRITVTGYKAEDDFVFVTSVEKDGETYVLAEPENFEENYYGRGHMMGGPMMRGYGPGYRGRADHPMWHGNGGWFRDRGGPCW
jgi:hypothetical protein